MAVAAPAVAGASDDGALQAQNLKWQSRPDGRAFARAFPIEAQNKDVVGRARVLCTVSANYTLTACETLEETPAGYQFGDAAAKLAGQFKLQHDQPDQRAVPGAKVAVGIVFNLPGHMYGREKK